MTGDVADAGVVGVAEVSLRNFSFIQSAPKRFFARRGQGLIGFFRVSVCAGCQVAEDRIEVEVGEVAVGEVIEEEVGNLGSFSGTWHPFFWLLSSSQTGRFRNGPGGLCPA